MCDCEYEEQVNEPENKKFELVDASNYGRRKAYRIRALRDFGDVQKGMLGGYVEDESCLSHDGDCWIYDSAFVGKGCCVSGNSKIYGRSQIKGNVSVSGESSISDGCLITGSSIYVTSSRIVNSAGIYLLCVSGCDFSIEQSLVCVSLCGSRERYHKAEILSSDDFLHYGTFEDANNFVVHRSIKDGLTFRGYIFNHYKYANYTEMVKFFSERLDEVSKRQAKTIECMIAAIDDKFDEVDFAEDIKKYRETIRK